MTQAMKDRSMDRLAAEARRNRREMERHDRGRAMPTKSVALDDFGRGAARNDGGRGVRPIKSSVRDGDT